MSDASATVSGGAKKGVVLVLLIAAAVFLVFFLSTQGSSRKGEQKSKIIGLGDRAPEFTLLSLSGEQVRLSDYRGKVVMVHFWATWCPPCVEEAPAIEHLYQRMSGKNFVVLAVSVDQGGTEAVNAFMRKHALTFPVLLDGDRSVAGAYGTFRFPETYIIDKNGMVIEKAVGPRDWTVPAVVDAVQRMVDAG